MSVKITRTTSAVTEIPAEVETSSHLRIKNDYVTRLFRPTTIIEQVSQSSGASFGADYTITVTGPAITTKGLDHARDRGRIRCLQEEDLPREIRPYLVGREALIAHTFAPEEK